ncbi:MAG: NTP transferase domain-containing protein [Gammaproteobacteria bacterium]|nr:NTP transferase domain-containing protein [Gammaproteobacteria bacterium]MCI0591499.1 NTP transferase domain-containing protein [Gammaproteobacteria bacterium]
MKGIILAGGLGTRLHPLTKATNKHLLPVGAEPMLYHPIRQLTGAGIRSILVVTSTLHMGDVVRCLGSGEEFGCHLSYKVQEKAGGIAHALALAEDFVLGEKICVILGDNVFEYSIAPYVDAFEKQEKGARVLLKEVGDPERFGVAALDEHQVLEIQEKPSNPKSSYAVVGLYLYDDQVFDVIRRIQPSLRGELEITAVNNAYIRKKQLQYDICRGRWTDAGTFESLFEANQIMLSNHNNILPHS